MTRVLLTHNRDMRKHFFSERAVDALRAVVELRTNDTDKPLRGDALVAAAHGCSIIISDRLAAGTREVFNGLQGVSTFIRCAVDIRNIDVDAASDNNVLVCKSSAGYADCVGEHAIALMLDLAHGISGSAALYHAGEAHHPMTMRRQLAGAHVGVIGYGAIGRRIVELALALSMKVSVYDPYATIRHGAVQVVSFEEVLSRPDYVICAAYATPETARMMNADAFGLMRRDAYFINISRGILVDDDALERALLDGKIAGAGLDVGMGPDEQPALRIARLPNVVATPHSSSAVREPSEHQAMENVEQVKAVLAGRLPLHAVNPHRVSGWGSTP